MKNEVEKLHTAIRRYCMDRYSYWTKKYGELASRGKDRAGYGYTQEALGTFPRYNVLNAILVEIERHRPEDFATLNEAKRAFSAAALDAQNIFTQPPSGDLEQKVMLEEREALCEFISQLSERDLLRIEPLFYRRVLSAEESNIIWERLKTIWRITEGYWYPLAQRERDDIEAFQDAYLEKEVGVEKLHSIFRNRGIERVWEMREDGINHELELAVFEPSYNGNEGYWCGETFDWIIYASHESSITIGGWLLPEIKNVWLSWKERVWTTPFFDQPLEGAAMNSQFPGAVPEIPVRDINEAAAYYERNLGFTVDWGDEELGLVGVSKGNCRMFLANSDFRKGYGNIGPVLTWLNLESKEEVDDLYRLWSASKAKLISAPESKPWGLHEFTAADPDGNLFRVFYDFATPEGEENA